MKVLIDTQPLYNANAIRGVGVYTRYLIQALKDLKLDDIEVITSDQADINYFAAKSSVDIIHYPFFDLFKNTLPLFHSGRQKIIVTIHDVIPLLFPEHYPVGIRGNIAFSLQKLALKNVSAVLTDSQASKTDIVKYLSMPAEKVHVVYLAGNPEIQQVSKSKQLEMKKKYNLPEKYILYVGDINYNKNIPELIKALTFIDESVHLVCLGKNFRSQGIPEWHAIRSTIDKYKLASRVHFISNLSKNSTGELSAFYSAADCYVQPSLYEGFGLPVLEALQCDTKVVASQNSSLTEIGGEVVEYCQPTAKDIGDKVEKVLKEGRSENWSKKVREHLGKFSWKKTAVETAEVYKKMKN